MSDELRGWKEICAYLRTSVSTAQRWERDMALPVHRIGNSPSATVYAHAAELDAWRLAYEAAEHAESGTNAAIAEDTSSASSHEPILSQADETRLATNSRVVAAPRFRLVRFLRPFAILVAILVIAAVIVFGRLTSWSRAVQRVQPIEPYAAQKSTRLVVVKITAPDKREFVARVADGTMATIAVPGLVKLGLTATIRGSGLKVGICEITPTRTGAEALKVLRIIPLSEAGVTSFAWGPSNVRLEWLGTAAEAANTPPPGDGPPAKCCVTCDHSVACATQVVGPCGSCRAVPGGTGAPVPK